MAGRYGPNAVFINVAGYDLTPDDCKSISEKVESVIVETTGLGSAWQKFTPTGESRAEYEIAGGYFDTGTNRSHAALKTIANGPQSAVRVALVATYNTAGAPCVGHEGLHEHSYRVTAARGELHLAEAGFTVTGQRDQCILLQIHESKSADWDTESAAYDHTTDPSQRVIPITSNSQADPSVVTTTVPHGLTSGDKVLIAGVADSNADINGPRVATVISTTTFSVPVPATSSAGTGGTMVLADSADGGVGYLVCSAASGFSAFVAKIEDSPDDATWADLIVFADNVSAPFAERKTVAGDVDRYLAVDGNVTGTGSVTCAVAFKRNPAA